MISMIWCEDKKHGIGINNALPWKIKDEMDHFRETTINQIVVCGEKTYASWGGRPLKNRTNIVLTLDKNFKSDECIVYYDINQLINDYKDKHIFIIGGKSIYNAFFPFADELIISTLKQEYECNMFMEFDLSDFNKTKTVDHELFTINYYQRKK